MPGDAGQRICTVAFDQVLERSWLVIVFDGFLKCPHMRLCKRTQITRHGMEADGKCTVLNKHLCRSTCDGNHSTLVSQYVTLQALRTPRSICTLSCQAPHLLIECPGTAHHGESAMDSEKLPARDCGVERADGCYTHGVTTAIHHTMWSPRGTQLKTKSSMSTTMYGRKYDACDRRLQILLSGIQTKQDRHRIGFHLFAHLRKKLHHPASVKTMLAKALTDLSTEAHLSSISCPSR